jgi:hypothetical protein
MYGVAACGPVGLGLVCNTYYSFSMLWGGEAFQELGVQSADVSALLGVLPHSNKSPASCQIPWITEVRRSVAVFRLPSWILTYFSFLSPSILEQL